jgi:hypothetical protein
MDDDRRRTYIVECFEPGAARADIAAEASRARAAAAELRVEGHGVDYLSSMVVQEDEVVFHIFSADQPETVREASTRAGVPFERIIVSLALDPVREDGR